MYGVPIISARNYGLLTQAFGTVIARLIEPVAGAYTRLKSLWYTCSTTAHVLTVMRPLGICTFTADGAAGQAVVNLSINPGNYSAMCSVTPRTANNLLAANDYVVYEAADGTYVLDTVSSISGLAVTLTTNLPTGGVVRGGKLWHFGIITDVNPHNAQAHPTWNLKASLVTYLGNDEEDGWSGFVGTLPGLAGSGLTGRHEPLICHSGNATVAGTLEKVTAHYTAR